MPYQLKRKVRKRKKTPKKVRRKKAQKKKKVERKATPKRKKTPKKKSIDISYIIDGTPCKTAPEDSFVTFFFRIL